MRFERQLSLLLTALFASASLTAQAAGPSAYERALEKAKLAVEDLEMEEARGWLDVALTTYETPAQRGLALDLLGSLEGIETNYAAALRHFVAAARLGGAEAVGSREHPQSATRLLARCAVALVEGGLQITEVEAQLRGENGIKFSADLNEGLRKVLFEETFVCPRLEASKPVAAAPPAVEVVKPETKPEPVAQLAEDKGGVVPEPPLVTWILGGVALAAVGTGGVLAGVATADADGLRAQNFQRDLDSVEDTYAAANVAYATAGVAALGAVLFWLLDGGDDAPAAEVDVGPGAVVVRF